MSPRRHPAGGQFASPAHSARTNRHLISRRANHVTSLGCTWRGRQLAWPREEEREGEREEALFGVLCCLEASSLSRARWNSEAGERGLGGAQWPMGGAPAHAFHWPREFRIASTSAGCQCASTAHRRQAHAPLATQPAQIQLSSAQLGPNSSWLARANKWSQALMDRWRGLGAS